MTKKQLPPHLHKVFKLLPLGMDLPITGGGHGTADRLGHSNH